MKQLKYAKKIQIESNIFAQNMTTYCNKINKEYLNSVNKLIDQIALGENLDAEMLKKKYIKKTVKSMNDVSDVMLDKMVINGRAYYYEKIQDGNVYDKNAHTVGVYTNNQITLNAI